MPRTALGLLLVALVGCANTRSDKVVSEYQPGGPALTQSAPSSTVYALYRIADAANQPGRVLRAQVHVHTGFAVGFGRSEDGKPFAVAGAKTFPLADGWYQWEVVNTDGEATGAEALLYYPRRWRDAWAEPTRSSLETIGQVIALPFMAALLAVVVPLWILIGCPMIGGG